ncbi:MAG: FtsQ-type POTRA domain-containing protein [Verrucomicrobia bacterium]|jgi:cell division protein FtsQ|nr:FtsQ-type POTRA domain-containing protein [Verrucomicrobiota bacterium]
MWFRRKQKNKRNSRGRVLDVKLRSVQVRKSRMRLGALTFGVAFGTVFGLYVLWRVGEWTLDRLVYENRAFAIQQIDARTDGVISADQLQRWTGVRPGQNLFALDLARVKRDLEMVPLIDSVSVERVLPRTLRIRVTEREAVAQVNVPRPNNRGGVEVAVFHLDPEGFVMVPLDPRQRTTPLAQPDDLLPVLTGVGLHELQPGRRLELRQVRAALNLIVEFARSPMAGLVGLRRIDVAAPEILVVTTGQGSEVTFGLEDLERQLRRWREIHDLGQRTHRSIASLNLAVTNNIPARWLEASIAPAASPKLPKTLRKKKNV